MVVVGISGERPVGGREAVLRELDRILLTASAPFLCVASAAAQAPDVVDPAAYALATTVDPTSQVISSGQGVVLGALFICSAALVGLSFARNRLFAHSAPAAAAFVIAAAFYEATAFNAFAQISWLQELAPPLARVLFASTALIFLAQALALARGRNRSAC